MQETQKPAQLAPAGIPTGALALLSFAAFGSGISTRTADPLLPLLAREFAVSLGDASLVITVFSVAYGVAQLLFGPLGDRYGKYFVIACATLASAATALLCALAPGLQALLAMRLLAGATAAAIIPLSMAWIGDVIPYDQRQPVLARFLIGQILGVSAGVLAGGMAADAHQWRLPFFFAALIFLLVGAGLLALNRRLPDHARAHRPMQGNVALHMLADFRHIASLPWARLVLATVFLEGGLVYGAFAFIASHLHRVHGISLTLAGAILMLFGFGGFAFALASGPLVRRLGERGLVRSGGLILAVSLAVIGLAPLWWLAIPASFGAGLGFYMLHNTLQIHATQMAPDRRGTAVSAFASCFFLGQALGVGLAGLLVARAGTMPILASCGIGLFAVSAVFAYRLRTRMR